MKYLALIALLSACCPYPERCDAYVRGACVVGLESVADPDKVVTGLEYGADLGLQYWGLPPDFLDGFVIELTDFACGKWSGCYHGDCRVIELSSVRGCYEFSLPHEIGHAVIHDPDHTSDRWCGVQQTCLDPPEWWQPRESPYCN